MMAPHHSMGRIAITMASTINAFDLLSGAGESVGSAKAKKKKAKAKPQAAVKTDEAPSSTAVGTAAPSDSGEIADAANAASLLESSARTYSAGPDRLKLWRDWTKQVVICYTTAPPQGCVAACRAVSGMGCTLQPLLLLMPPLCLPPARPLPQASSRAAKYRTSNGGMIAFKEVMTLTTARCRALTMRLPVDHRTASVFSLAAFFSRCHPGCSMLPA